MIPADVTTRVTRLAWPYVDSLSRSLPFAAAVQAGIDFERMVDRRRALSLDLVARATGHATRGQVLRRREGEDRRRLLADMSVHDEGRLGSTAFWHESGSGPTLLLINGWTASGLMWPHRFVERLERSFRVVRVDNRGTGYSRSAPAPYTLADLADDAAAVLRARGGGEPAAVLGISMGGMIAQELAIRHPEVVERLVLCGTRPPAPAGFAPSRSVLNAMTSMPRSGENIGEFFERTWAAVVGNGFREHHPDAIGEVVERLCERPTPRAGVINQMRAISGWSGASRLARITAPTVVLHGSDDPLIPVGNGMRLAQLIADAAYVELPGVGHLVPYEAPDALLAAIRAS
jgi:3-oxoadipate enol-lactonase